MAVKLRLTRMGKTKQPMYRVVATDSHTKRDGEYIELIGTYNPVTKSLGGIGNFSLNNLIRSFFNVSCIL